MTKRTNHYLYHKGTTRYNKYYWYHMIQHTLLALLFPCILSALHYMDYIILLVLYLMNYTIGTAYMEYIIGTTCFNIIIGTTFPMNIIGITYYGLYYIIGIISYGLYYWYPIYGLCWHYMPQQTSMALHDLIYVIGIT